VNRSCQNANGAKTRELLDGFVENMSVVNVEKPGNNNPKMEVSGDYRSWRRNM